MPVDRERLLQETDILAVVERDIGPPARSSGRWVTWRCPFPGHKGGADRTPSLKVTGDDGKWKCFGCGRGGNVIDWVMEYDGVEFLEACRRLRAVEVREPGPGRRVQVERVLRHEPPGEPWQSRALELVEECVTALWGEAGERARAYLYSRGFVDATILEWRLGLQPTKYRFERLEDWGIERPDDGKRHGMWLPRGITIPCWAKNGEELQYVKVRRSPADRTSKIPTKYVKLAVPAGCGGTGLYGEHGLRQRSVLFLEEGEFNALIIWQEAGDLLDVVSTGTSSVRPETLEPWWGYLLMAQTVLTRFDPDASGRMSAERWQALSRRVRVVQVPEGGDPNEFLARYEGDVRAWIQWELARLEKEAR